MSASRSRTPTVPVAREKVAEYERLKEFSENIVESINVGILAADLDDRVESWNSQMERSPGFRADQAAGTAAVRTCSRRSCARNSMNVRGETGVHHIYKFVLRRGG